MSEGCLKMGVAVRRHARQALYLCTQALAVHLTSQGSKTSNVLACIPCPSRLLGQEAGKRSPHGRHWRWHTPGCEFEAPVT